MKEGFYGWVFVSLVLWDDFLASIPRLIISFLVAFMVASLFAIILGLFIEVLKIMFKKVSTIYG